MVDFTIIPKSIKNQSFTEAQEMMELWAKLKLQELTDDGTLRALKFDFAVMWFCGAQFILTKAKKKDKKKWRKLLKERGLI